MMRTETEREQELGSERTYGNGDGSRGGAGTETGVETRRRTQDGSGDGNKSSSGDGNGYEGRDGYENGDGIGESGEETKERKKPQKSYRRNVRNGEDLVRKRNKRRQESVGSVVADPDNLENSNEAGREAQSTQDLSKNLTTSR